MSESVSSLDKAAIATLKIVTTCDKNTGERVVNESAIKELSNGELLNVVRASAVSSDPANSDNIFKSTGLINSSISEIAQKTFKERLRDAIEEGREKYLSENQNLWADFGLLTAEDWAKFTRASRIINDGLAYLAMDSYIDNARLAKQTTNAKYLKKIKQNFSKILLDGVELDISKKAGYKIIDAVRMGSKGKNGVTIAAIGDAKILRSKVVQGKSMVIIERKDNLGKSILIATDKVDLPKNKKEAQFFARKLATEQLPTAGLPLAHPETSGYMNRLTQMYVKHKKNPLISKIIRKLPVAGTVTGVWDATKQFWKGDWFSGTMTLLGEVAKGVMAIPVGAYNLTEIGLHLAGYEITQVYESGWESLKAKYKETFVDSDSMVCEEEDPEPKKRRYWDDYRGQWVDEVTATIDSTFSHDGSLLIASEDLKSSMQNRDTFILTPKKDGSLWKPEIKLNGAPSNTKVDIRVHPYLPDNLGSWNFRFYDGTFVNTTIDCYEYVGLDHRANRTDVLEAINHFTSYSSGQRYVNGEPYGEIRHDPIDLNRSQYLTVSMSIPGKAKEEGYFPGMGMGGPYCTDPLYDTSISYTLTLTEVV